MEAKKRDLWSLGRKRRKKKRPWPGRERPVVKSEAVAAPLKKKKNGRREVTSREGPSGAGLHEISDHDFASRGEGKTGEESAGRGGQRASGKRKNQSIVLSIARPTCREGKRYPGEQCNRTRRNKLQGLGDRPFWKPRKRGQRDPHPGSVIGACQGRGLG